MGKAKVFFTDFHTRDYGEGHPKKLKRLIKAAGISDIDMDGKLVAIKMHFGELGNCAYLRPNYVKAVADVVKELGGKPFLTDCNTMYPGSRKNAVEHLFCAYENGFNTVTTGCPIIIADGLKGTDDVEVPVKGGEYVKNAKIGRAVMDADVFISLNHFKGHNNASFGGAIKNIGMGCGSRAGKKEQHSSGLAMIDPDKCRGCRKCLANCANDGLHFDEVTRKMSVTTHCVGCGNCLGACNFDAIHFEQDTANELLSRRMAEYAKAVVDGRPQFHISLVMDVSPGCDCHAENDAPIIPDLGMFASFDPLAIDQACVDACLAATPIPEGRLAKMMKLKEFVDYGNHFENLHPGSDWKSCLEQAEKIGLGSREYELIPIKTDF